MKAKTIKKTLSLFLAVLMIALTLPFALLTVSAEEITEIDITGVTLFGNYLKDDLSTQAIGFYGSYPAVNAFDGDITSDAQNSNGDDLDYQMCYFDADGVMQNGENASGTSYYVVWIFELAAETEIDTLELWTSFNDDRWMANNGYDIYYSADGSAYTAAEDASYSNVYSEVATNGYYVAGTYNSTSGFVHEIDMKDASAKYIAIAVSDLIVERDETIFHEVVVKGISEQVPPAVSPNEATEIAVAGVTAFGNYVNEDQTTRKIAFYGTYPAKNAFDGDITTDAQTANTSDLPYEKCYFDADGVMQNGENASGTSYYVVWIFELAAEATVDTLELWASYTDRWMANNGYDVYYSADGTAYTAAEDASYSNVFTEKDTNGYYVSGTYNSKDGSVHEIDMKDATAKYIAIAVSDLVFERDETIFQEVVVKGAYVGGAPSNNENTDTQPSDEPVPGGDYAPPTAVTEEAEESEAETSEKKGCGSSLTFGGVALVSACALGALVKSKKKED